MTAWQVFVILIIGFLLTSSFWTGPPMIVYPAKIFGYLIIVGYKFLIGWELYRMIGSKWIFNFNLFIINSIIIGIGWPLIMVLTNYRGLSFNIQNGIPLLYFAFAFLHTHALPMKMLVSIEENRKVNFGAYFGELLLLTIWPIGVWFIQPRLNKITS